MDSPKQIMQFIERNELGYVLGCAVRSILRSVEGAGPTENENNYKLKHLKDSRLFLNDEIKRLSRKEIKKDKTK
jgi:hypothetical protein